MTTEYRQAVECEARNPCIHDRNDIKSAEGTTEKKKKFCRTYGAMIYRKHHFAGIPHFVLHTCLYSVAPTELIWMLYGFLGFGFLVVNGHSSKFRVQSSKKGAAMKSSSFYL